MSCTRPRILLNTICRKSGFNSLRRPLNHGAEQASNETLKQTQQRNWSNASQGGQTALKEHFAVLHYDTTSTTQQPRGEHRGTIKDCKIAGATTWQGQGNHTFTTVGICVIVCIQKPLHHFLQTFLPLRMSNIVFRDSSLYPEQLSLFCLLWLISASVDRSGCITNFCGMVELLHELKNSNC